MEIYTDGGCIENPGGIGAWAFVAVANGQVLHRESGVDMTTTNNRMELQAVIKAMEWAGAGAVITVFTDSDLTVKCGNGVWKRRANRDLWGRFGQLRASLLLHLLWVRGHNGNRWNEMADEMCTEAMRVAAEERDPNVAHLKAILAE